MTARPRTSTSTEGRFGGAPCKGYLRARGIRAAIQMPKEGKKGSGFQSAAGLIRYFDSEDEKALKINPYFVLIFAAFLILVVELAKVIWPY